MSSSTETSEILALHAEWIAAEREGRRERLLELCTPGVILQPPIGAPAEGIEAVREMLGAGQPLHMLEIESTEVSVSERLAVLRARFATQTRPGAPVVRGHHLLVLRPRWRVSMANWSFDAPVD